MDNTNSSVIGMKKKDATKMDIVQLDKSQTYPEEKVIRDIYVSQVNYMEIKKYRLLTLSGVKIALG